MNKVHSYLLVITFIATSCSTIRMSYQAPVKNKKTKEERIFVFEKSYDLGPLCPITAILWGGACWTYLGYPKDEHLSEAKKDAQKKLDEVIGENNWEILEEPKIAKKNWSNLSENFYLKNPACESAFTLIHPQKNSGLNFKGSDFEVNFMIEKISSGDNFLKSLSGETSGADYTIGFLLKNISASPIKIIWDESAFVSPYGQSHSVIHSGVKFISKEDPQSPTLVAPGSTLSDILIPKDSIKWINSSWYFSPYEFENHSGKEFGVFLTIEIGGKRQSISFKFYIC